MNKQYHKIRTLFKREEQKPHNMMVGTYAFPEFELLKDIEWIWTEKIDGTNVRVHWDGQKVSFHGKSDNAQMPVFLMHKLEEMFGGEANEQVFEQNFGEDPVTFYGEGYGAKIQKGGGDYIEDGVSFVLFDVRAGDLWLTHESVEDIGKKFDVDVAPIVGKGTLAEAVEFASKQFDSKFGKAKAEGIIVKPSVELKDRRGGRIISKLKYKDFEKLNG